MNCMITTQVIVIAKLATTYITSGPAAGVKQQEHSLATSPITNTTDKNCKKILRDQSVIHRQN